MDFTCFVCLKKFDTVENTIQHFKKIHRLRNNAQNFKCIANPWFCNKTVRTFIALKTHSLLCLKLNQISALGNEVNV